MLSNLPLKTWLKKKIIIDEKKKRDKTDSDQIKSGNLLQWGRESQWES